MIPLDKHVILNHLNDQTKRCITTIDVEQSVTSTNDIILTFAKKNPVESHVLFAEEQTAGRGRLGRSWVSPANKNIYFSLSWHFKKSIREIADLSVAIGKCLAIALKTFGITQPITIKYPNDLMHAHKKFGGILIETIAVNQSECVAIIGIGINVNSDAEVLTAIDQPSTSLLLITGQAQDRNQLAACILNALCDKLCNY